MNNLFISNLNEKDTNHFTSNQGLYLRKKGDKVFKKLCNLFTNANIIRMNLGENMTDDEYYASLDTKKIPLSNYDLKEGKNNIILERYPKLEKDESYIFVCNHTCPEDIETVLNIIDRNAYLVLGSVKTLREEMDGYLVWLNGTLPFDISDQSQRKEVIPKSERILKTNSILIFPEGSHNLNPNKLINPLFDGPINMALKKRKKIVLLTLIRDSEKNISYVDASNPIDVEKMSKEMNNGLVCNTEKEQVKKMTSILRDKMATSVMYILLRHDDMIKRNQYRNVEAYLRTMKIYDSFKRLDWKVQDDFAGEFKTKITKDEKEYQAIIRDMSLLTKKNKNLTFNEDYWVNLEKDLENKNIPKVMKEYAKKLVKIKNR